MVMMGQDWRCSAAYMLWVSSCSLLSMLAGVALPVALYWLQASNRQMLHHWPAVAWQANFKQPVLQAE
jgi:hypothetical protein